MSKFKVGDSVICTVKPEETGRPSIIGAIGIISWINYEIDTPYALVTTKNGETLDILVNRLRKLTKLDKALK